MQIYVSKHIYAAGDSALAQECYGQLYKAGATIHLSPWYCTLLPPSICMGAHSLTLSPHPDTYSHAKFWIVDRGTSRQHVGMSTGNWSPTDYPPADVFPPYGQGNWVKVRCSWERVYGLPHTPHRVRAPVCVLCCVQANRDYTMRMWGEEVVAQFSSVFHNDLIRGTEWYPANTTAL